MFIFLSEYWLPGCIYLADVYQAVHLNLCTSCVYSMLQNKTPISLLSILTPYTNSSYFWFFLSLLLKTVLDFLETKQIIDFVNDSFLLWEKQKKRATGYQPLFCVALAPLFQVFSGLLTIIPMLWRSQDPVVRVYQLVI